MKRLYKIICTFSIIGFIVSSPTILLRLFAGIRYLCKRDFVNTMIIWIILWIVTAFFIVKIVDIWNRKQAIVPLKKRTNKDFLSKFLVTFSTLGFLFVLSIVIAFLIEDHLFYLVSYIICAH